MKQKSRVLRLEELVQEVQSILNLLWCQVREILGTQPPPDPTQLPAAGPPGRSGVDVLEPHLQPLPALLQLLVLPDVMH